MFAKQVIPKELVTLSEEQLQQCAPLPEGTEDRLTIPAGTKNVKRGSSGKSAAAALE